MIRLYTTAIGAVLMLGLAAAAPAQGSRDRATGSGDRGAMRKDRADGESRGERELLTRRLFRGIELTADQRLQLDGVRKRYEPRFAALRDSMRPAHAKLRAARRTGDTVAMRAAKDEIGEERKAIQTLTEQLHADARTVLTPEQRTTFDRNVAELRLRMTKRRERVTEPSDIQ